ncbi:hypothetical protein C8Q74DRAFT_1447183 [Fomes fomentarius]|nr:hypothetical protein C8Q74DRAFT_1447183 [Fomes fomentarius]
MPYSMDASNKGHASGALPISTAYPPRLRPSSQRSVLVFFILLAATSTVYYFVYRLGDRDESVVIPLDARWILGKCRSLQLKPGPPSDFHSRAYSDRYQPGTEALLIRNATVWTGNFNGSEVLRGDVFLDKGIIKAVRNPLGAYLSSSKVNAIDAKGAWLTPGVVDLHSHLAVESSPALDGAGDGNSENGPILPWLRVLDALNTHDDAYPNSISGGVTTSLVLPGSLNGIGGQGLVIKLRHTEERSPSSMVLEPPLGYNGSTYAPDTPPRWGHMKHACGENPRYYQATRMDTVWAVRQAYDTARTIKNAQDAFCEKALAGEWRSLGGQKFPESLQWQPLIDVLRGRTKVQTHCYEALDLDNFVRLSNEFEFEVAAFHHAHEAYLVPEVLRRAYKNPPAVAMFSTFSRYKREAYRHSEFAPRVLADEGLDVIMKSDHPAIPSRNLIGEAAIAHHYGLPENLALASVISTPAKVLGLDHRIGFIKEGYDADVVLWDSHPLSLGATPTQVIIDGILQFHRPHVAPKPSTHQHTPRTPSYDKETAQTLAHDGLPPLVPKNYRALVVFANVTHFWSRIPSEGTFMDLFAEQHALGGEAQGIVVVNEGDVVCSGLATECAAHLSSPTATVIDLRGGAIQPGLVSYGADLGLLEIAMEPSTRDGYVADPLDGQPAIFGSGGYVAKAVDGLQFGTRDALLAYRSGVTIGVTSPSHGSWLSGLSTAFTLGAPHKLSRGAILRDIVAVHCSLSLGADKHSVSTKIAALRRLLTRDVDGEIGTWFKKVANGTIPLVVNVGSADIIATLISLKKEVEAKASNTIKLTIAGGTEAHLLASELAAANVGVIVTPTRSYTPWPPLTADSLVGYLIKHNVTVGVGPRGIGAIGHPYTIEMANSRARNLRFDVGEARLDAGPGLLDKGGAFALASSSVEKLLGLDLNTGEHDLVATAGGDLLDYEGKVIAVISPRRKLVDIF